MLLLNWRCLKHLLFYFNEFLPISFDFISARQQPYILYTIYKIIIIISKYYNTTIISISTSTRQQSPSDQTSGLDIMATCCPDQLSPRTKIQDPVSTPPPVTGRFKIPVTSFITYFWYMAIAGSIKYTIYSRKTYIIYYIYYYIYF